MEFSGHSASFLRLKKKKDLLNYNLPEVVPKDLLTNTFFSILIFRFLVIQFILFTKVPYVVQILGDITLDMF